MYDYCDLHLCTLRCLINVPPLFNFFQPPDLIRTPRLLIFKKIEFSTSLLCYFLSLLELFTPNFPGKVTCFCVYFSVTLCDSLFLFFPLLYNDFNPFLAFRPPPRLLNFGSFSNPPDYWDPPPVYLTLESMNYEEYYVIKF